VELRALSQDLFGRADATLRYRLEGSRLVELDRGQERAAPRLAEGQRVPSELMMAGRTEEALAAYRALRAAAPADPALAEARLNRLGYAHLGAGRKAQAVACFGLNTEWHPTSANAWDSLGEGCLAAGDTARAAACYRKVLEVLDADATAPAGLKAALRRNAQEALARLAPPR
jgi:Flp pilus assembly protein TadD